LVSWPWLGCGANSLDSHGGMVASIFLLPSHDGGGGGVASDGNGGGTTSGRGLAARRRRADVGRGPHLLPHGRRRRRDARAPPRQGPRLGVPLQRRLPLRPLRHRPQARRQRLRRHRHHSLREFLGRHRVMSLVTYGAVTPRRRRQHSPDDGCVGLCCCS
jgi:hypothetical protein